MLGHGILIALEGIDGAGKTTQARLLQAALKAGGFTVVSTKEPTDGPYGQMLRNSATSGRMTPEEELRAFTEDRRQHVSQLIAPALAAGKIVVVDRYYFSSAAYQGIRGIDAASILCTNEAFAPQPDLLVVLDVPPRVGLARIRGRGDTANLFEEEQSLAQIAELFASFDRPYKWTLDGTLPPDRVLRLLLTHLVDEVIFKRMCFKQNKDTCEPAYCVYRAAGACSFPSIPSVEHMVAAAMTASAAR